VTKNSTNGSINTGETMAHCLIELYSPKPAWLALDRPARERFFAAIETGMADLSTLGIEAIAFGETEADTLHAAAQRFFAVWRAPDARAMSALVAGIAASGWHDYFETINATGAAGDLATHVAQLAAA
jgi:hypothetical protein